MENVPLPILMLLAVGAFAVGVFGLREWLEIRAAFREGELDRLDADGRRLWSRALAALIAALPVWAATTPLGDGRWMAAMAVAGLAFAVAPRFIAASRERVEDEMREALPLHLDLVALAMEGGATLPAAIALCAEHAPEGTLRRAWKRVLLDIHGGAEPLDALRALEDRLGFPLFGNLPAALRSADKFGIDAASILREKARQAAGARFSRAEQLARAAPLKLWATLMLCLAPCTLVVLAFPVAKILVVLAGN